MHKLKTRNLILPLTGLCIIALTIYRSFESVSGLSRTDPTYYTLLDENVIQLRQALKTANSDEAKFRRKEDLALALWQNGKYSEAAEYLRDLWKEQESKCTAVSYNSHFVENALNLAGYYLDSGNFKESQRCYEIILKYEQNHLKSGDLRVARDQNNLGLSHYMMAQTSASERSIELNKAMQCYKQAEDAFRLCPSAKVQLLANLQNQALALEDLGRWDSAHTLNAKVDAFLAAWHQTK